MNPSLWFINFVAFYFMFQILVLPFSRKLPGVRTYLLEIEKLLPQILFPFLATMINLPQNRIYFSCKIDITPIYPSFVRPRSNLSYSKQEYIHNTRTYRRCILSLIQNPDDDTRSNTMINGFMFHCRHSLGLSHHFLKNNGSKIMMASLSLPEIERWLTKLMEETYFLSPRNSNVRIYLSPLQLANFSNFLSNTERFVCEA